MSKVALKGDALGTGTVTLSAPNTNAAIDFELPITGTHLASAQADGMPLGPGGDPVVESGSNSDGEWTRFADGTQRCWVSIPFGTRSTLSWTYPVTYKTMTVANGTANPTSAQAQAVRADSTTGTTHNIADRTATSFTVYIVNGTSAFGWNLLVDGFWK